MPGTIGEFYDDLAAHYHLMFEDWGASIARQATVLGPLLQHECGPGARVLDCACGVGTQALGLAAAGFRVTGSDASVAALAHAGSEAALRGLEFPRFHADMRDLNAVPGDFDAVIAMDNALPHLESAADLLRAAEAIRGKLRPGGVFLGSIRDYDLLTVDRPTVQGPAFYGDHCARRIIFQIWDWIDQRRYTFHLYITRQTEDGGWRTHHGASSYRAVMREELSDIFRSAGFSEIHWRMPAESGYYQPIVLARR